MQNLARKAPNFLANFKPNFAFCFRRNLPKNPTVRIFSAQISFYKDRHFIQLLFLAFCPYRRIFVILPCATSFLIYILLHLVARFLKPKPVDELITSSRSSPIVSKIPRAKSGLTPPKTPQ